MFYERLATSHEETEPQGHPFLLKGTGRRIARKHARSASLPKIRGGEEEDREAGDAGSDYQPHADP